MCKHRGTSSADGLERDRGSRHRRILGRIVLDRPAPFRGGNCSSALIPLPFDHHQVFPLLGVLIANAMFMSPMLAVLKARASQDLREVWGWPFPRAPPPYFALATQSFLTSLRPEQRESDRPVSPEEAPGFHTIVFDRFLLIVFL